MAFEKLGVKNFDNFYTKESANPIFESLETGHISNEDFYAALQSHCRQGSTFKEIQHAWNEILLDFRRESVTHLVYLKQKYNLYLLSNTNAIHHAEFSEAYKLENNGRKFDDNFIKAYYSHQIQKRKPYPETYLHVLNDAGVIAKETLFIDDSLANIEGAAQAGLQTKMLLPSERIEQLEL
jgi:putative hydrolase of the HAD superfamily